MRSWIEVDRTATRVTTKVSQDRTSFIDGKQGFPDFNFADAAVAQSEERSFEYDVNVAFSLSYDEARSVYEALESSGSSLLQVTAFSWALVKVSEQAKNKQHELNGTAK